MTDHDIWRRRDMHAVRKPIVQISRSADRLPFDVGQVRTVIVDTTDIYTLVPHLGA